MPCYALMWMKLQCKFCASLNLLSKDETRLALSTTMAFRKKKRFSSKPSSQFKKALRKLKQCKSDKQKCNLLVNSSDEFIRDLALTINKCLPIYKPMLSGSYLNKVKTFSNPRGSNSRRRKMIQHGGGQFINMLKDLGESVHNIIHSRLGKVLLSAAPLLFL